MWWHSSLCGAVGLHQHLQLWNVCSRPECGFNFSSQGKRGREIFCQIEVKVTAWLMLPCKDWGLPRKKWWIDLLGPNSTSTLWVLSEILKPSPRSDYFFQVAGWLEGMEKKMVGRVFQSIKRRHARQVTHSSRKINVCAWGGPREVNHILNILFVYTAYFILYRLSRN